ncbi:MAG: hypothetical protein E3J70_10830 [Candidatus Heimdallarchaeota archaeon]|nr:MAG: hypothetical protein E3J70_10830 [Candidatus Heimdallarchaeota archaeon]
MKRRSDDLDKWIAILSKLAQCEDGSSDDQKLGISFYAIRSSAVSDYHKLTEILNDMEDRGFIQIIEDDKKQLEAQEISIKRYKITIKGMKTLFEILIPARDALRKLDY